MSNVFNIKDTILKMITKDGKKIKVGIIEAFGSYGLKDGINNFLVNETGELINIDIMRLPDMPNSYDKYIVKIVYSYD